MSRNSAANIRRFSTPQPRVLILMALFLVLMLVLFGAWEYRTNKDQLASLLREEAIQVSHMMSLGGERLLFASRELEKQLEDRLLDKARLLDMVEQERELTPAVLRELLPDTSMMRLMMFNSEGVRTFPTGPVMPPHPIDTRLHGKPPPGRGRPDSRPHRKPPPDQFMVPVQLPHELETVLSGELQVKVVGIPRNHFRGNNNFLLAYHRTQGGVFLLQINVADMQRRNRDASIEGLLERIYTRPNVAWVGLYDQNSLRDSNSGDFPPLGETPSPVINSAEFLQIKDNAGHSHTILDVTVPLRTPLMRQGFLRVGFTGDRLDTGRTMITRALLIRSGFFLLLGLLLFYYFLVYSNYRTLAREYDRIRQEVEHLNQERQVVSRLQAMGELASGVAHEVRNPLNSIRMISQRLRLEFNLDKDEEYRVLTRTLQDESDRINRIITDFLTFARPAPLRTAPNSLESCITQAAAALKPRYDADDCELVLSIQPVPDFSFDYDRLSQLFHNLLANALQAVGSAGRVQVDVSRHAGNITVSIADNGCGIAPENLERIFNLYFTTRAEGSGIGLAVCHQIVSEHGGLIQVESELKQGTTFTITLPEQQETHS
jgi:signal transduction histidine kinase